MDQKTKGPRDERTKVSRTSGGSVEHGESACALRAFGVTRKVFSGSVVQFLAKARLADSAQQEKPAGLGVEGEG